MEKSPKFSIVIPTRNEEKSISKVIESIPENIRKQSEILVVDNSTDNTKAIAEAKGARVIDEPRKGYGRAYKTGFASASGEIIITSDGDLTYPVEKIGIYVKKLEDEGLDFITCDRLSLLDKRSMSATHRLGNRILTLAANMLFHMSINDSQSGMWIFRRKILPKLELKSDGMQFSEEIKIEAWRRGFSCMEIPVEYKKRVGDVKLNTWKDGIKNLLLIFKKRFT